MKIESKLYNLSEIVKERPDWHFNIPIYQRLYIWGEDQVLTLLNDLVNAYERGEDIFFLGGTLLVEQKEGNGRHFDLIDGQQRFTTLWLLCHAWRGALQPFLKTKSSEYAESRLRFAIRPEVNHFLETLAIDAPEKDWPDEEATKRMRTALGLMTSIFEKRDLPHGVTDKDAHLNGLTRFVFENVKFVITTVPRETDLNKLFEVINNRGVQLQHHEILKARMLDALSEEDRGAYAILWEACADMDSFIERNLSGISGLQAHVVTGLYEQGDLKKALYVRDKLNKQIQSRTNHHALGLMEILKQTEKFEAPEEEPTDENTSPTRVRSIFGFPLFLQHTLRIWLLNNKLPDLPRLLDKELLSLFEEFFFKDSINDSLAREKRVNSFILLLWRLRVIFDEHIIKWVDQGEEEIHLISSISVSTSNAKRYMSRSMETDTHRGFSLLQSMLYHSQEITTQYWLTPLLLFMLTKPNEKASRYYDYLRHLDNHLLGSAANENLVVRTRSFMEKPWQNRALIHNSELTQSKGVKFAHYWFYKLEFVLWSQQKSSTEGWKKFRFTAKNSVEHISPQTKRETDENRVERYLDHFGNLALVSRNLNSEYGNLPYNEKRQRFINNNKKRLDSLKMDLIYQNDKWNDDKSLAHQEQMIKCLDTYCKETPKE